MRGVPRGYFATFHAWRGGRRATKVFVLSLGFYITPALLGGARDMTVSMLIAQQVDQLNWPYAACLSAALLFVTLAIMAIFQAVFGVGRALRLADR